MKGPGEKAAAMRRVVPAGRLAVDAWAVARVGSVPTGGSVSSIVALAGSPSVGSRTVALLRHIASHTRDVEHDVEVVPIRALPADALLGADVDDPAVGEAVKKVADADSLIVASPVYKAAYSGVLKTFLDLLPPAALAGKTVLPILTGAAPVHALALDYALRPVLIALGARHVLTGLFLIDKQIERTPDGVVLAPDLQAKLDAAVAEL
jgi:FMN reductase